MKFFTPIFLFLLFWGCADNSHRYSVITEYHNFGDDVGKYGILKAYSIDTSFLEAHNDTDAYRMAYVFFHSGLAYFYNVKIKSNSLARLPITFKILNFKNEDLANKLNPILIGDIQQKVDTDNPIKKLIP